MQHKHVRKSRYAGLAAAVVAALFFAIMFLPQEALADGPFYLHLASGIRNGKLTATVGSESKDNNPDTTVDWSLTSATDVMLTTSANSGYTCTALTAKGSNDSPIDIAMTYDSSSAITGGEIKQLNQEARIEATFTGITYKVKFDGNGSTSGSMSEQTFTYDASQELTANTYTRDGHAFTGWNTKANGSGTSYTDKEKVKNLTATAGETITLYAQWTVGTYTVKFDANGGTGTAMSDQTFTYDVKQKLTANTYTRDNYTFAGWNTAADGSGTTYADTAEVSNLTTTAGGTVTLYAQWTAGTYTVKFDGNASETDVKNNYLSGTMSDQKITYDTATALTENAYELKYRTFAGWNTAADGSGTSYADKDPVTNLAAAGETATLYAQWTPNTYKVTFDANEGSGTMAAQEFTYGTSQALDANKYTRSGYTFSSWNTKKDGSGTKFSNRAKVKLSADVTLYAQWTKKSSSSSSSSSKSTTTRTTTSTKSSTLAKTADPSMLAAPAAMALAGAGFVVSGKNKRK